MNVTVCIGSSCYLKGSAEIVEKMKSKIEQLNLSDKITLAGSFCTGNCNRIGVSIQVDGKTYTGVTVDSFEEFFENNILKLINQGV